MVESHSRDGRQGHGGSRQGGQAQQRKPIGRNWRHRAGENPDSQGRAVRSPPGPLGTAIKK